MEKLSSRMYWYRIVWIGLVLCTLQGMGQPLFVDVAEKEGISFTHVSPDIKDDLLFGTGAAWVDCDNDGDLDLYISQRNGSNKLYRNNRIGTGTPNFTDITYGDAMDIDHDGAGVTVADYDNDGDKDLYLSNGDNDVLLQNQGGCSYTDVTAEAFPEFPGFMPSRGTTASWGDLNNDGWLDLYVVNHEARYRRGFSLQDFLLINNGNGTFRNESLALVGDFDEDGIADLEGAGFVAALTDLDNDDDLDIFVINECPYWPEDNKIWRNDGNLSFTEISDQVGPFIGGMMLPGSSTPKPDCQTAMGMAVGDPNRDGFMDYFYSNWNNSTETAIFLQNTGEQLLDKTQETGLKDSRVPESSAYRITWGASFLDLDNDMLLDLAVAAGEYLDNTGIFAVQPNLLYHNTGIENGLPNYTRLDDAESGIGDPYKARTIIKGDYDLDGDVDLLVINYEGQALLYNNQSTTDNHWIELEMVGDATMSNLDGIGAKVRVTTPDGTVQYEEIRSGSSLGGGEDAAAHFGLGAYDQVEVYVKWPSGVETNTGLIDADRRIKIYESEPTGQPDEQPQNLKTFPNPVEDICTLEYVVNDYSSLAISIKDLAGKEVLRLLRQNVVAPGSYQARADLSSLHKGFYMMVLNLGDRSYTQKILKD